MLESNTEERKEPLVSPGRSFAPGLPRPCFSTAVKNDDFITARDRKEGRSAPELAVRLQSWVPQGRDREIQTGQMTQEH